MKQWNAVEEYRPLTLYVPPFFLLWFIMYYPFIKIITHLNISKPRMKESAVIFLIIDQSYNSITYQHNSEEIICNVKGMNNTIL